MIGKKAKPITIVVVALIVVVVAVSTVVWLWFQIDIKRSEAAGFKTELEGFQDMLGSQSELVATVSNTEYQRSLIDSYFISETSFVPFIEQLEELATSTGVQLEKGALAGGDGSLTFTFRTEGSFNDTYYFLSLIERIPVGLTIERADLQSLTVQQNDMTEEIVWKGDFNVIVAGGK